MTDSLFESIAHQDPDIFGALRQEADRQRRNVVLIASENYASRAVLAASGSHLTNKYAEGYPGRRYYGGCEYVDVVEELARGRAQELFAAEHANVQPHSGAQANMAAYFALLEPGDVVLGMRLDMGGHLSHGSPVNFSGKLYNFVSYGVDRDTEIIDYAEIGRLAQEHQPKVIVAGSTAYSRTIDFARFREIADEVGALLVADVAHISGLIAGGVHPSPVPHAQVVTSTTHKTLRGPRGALILSTQALASKIDRAVFPFTQGGPLMHVIAAKAIAFAEALRPDFSEYQREVVSNARALAEALAAGGLRLVAGGTDTHLVLVDVSPLEITGRDAEEALGRVHITVNRNAIPYDSKPPRVASGLRLGTPAVTSRGFTSNDMTYIADWILRVLRNIGNDQIERSVAEEVASFTSRFPVPGLDNN